jgi:hypothetical protein
MTRPRAFHHSGRAGGGLMTGLMNFAPTPTLYLEAAPGTAGPEE